MPTKIMCKIDLKLGRVVLCTEGVTLEAINGEGKLDSKFNIIE